jgi:Asp-tRNA(Asn)/Glu-tRNA(Gln) amidotransferase A subunit family amidase
MKNSGRVLRGSLLLGLASTFLFSGCAMEPRSRSKDPGGIAFIAYWPSAAHGGQLRLAVKDNIDMRGIVTTAGSDFLAKHSPPARKDAQCLAIARQQKVQIVGKTNLSEFAVAPSGFNEHFGTPDNPFNHWRRKFIPGGSSSGSAVAVATGLADVAFGTDTAGSVRVPAACCGVVGLKTTYGLVPLGGVYPVEMKHLDTIGPLGKDIAQTARGMDLLQGGFSARYAATTAARPSASNIRIGRLALKGTDPKINRAVDHALAKTGFQVVALDDEFRKKWDQANKDANTVAAAGAWLSDRKFFSQLSVSARTKSVLIFGRLFYPGNYFEALSRQRQWQKTLRAVFKKVDFIALPTLQSTPPVILPAPNIGITELRMLDLQNTAAVNFAGNPALAMPIPLRRATVPVTSLQLVGPLRSEAELLNAGRLVEAALKK